VKRRIERAAAVIDVREFIREKRSGAAHAPERVKEFIAAYLRDEIADYQVSAWLMAAFLHGLNEDETNALTRALIDSGHTFDWTDLGRPSADKHSTGGVGDKISLILAPLVASCGVLVPMVSGRGLGHTGGTLDKLESIPGFRTRLSSDAMRDQLDRIGVVMVGQGPELAPADGRLYALRDVTATVEFEPFIVSSIVSKKVAEGAGAIVYDVKCGSGAFMTTAAAAGRLAARLVETTRAFGLRSSALITDMSWPLGLAVGNALEVREAVEVLRGKGPDDVRDLTLELAARMLRLAGAEPSVERGRARAERSLDSGEAWSTFERLVEAQGGKVDTVREPGRLPAAPVVSEVRAARAGRVNDLDTLRLGELVVEIGGGRRAKEDHVDPRVGVVLRVRRGEAVSAGQVLAELHLAGDDPEASRRAAECIRIEDRPRSPEKLVLGAVAD
jgi:pyrimidine-nucleoside phosphorylase